MSREFYVFRALGSINIGYTNDKENEYIKDELERRMQCAKSNECWSPGERQTVVYLLENRVTGALKIGISRDLIERIKALENASGSRIDLLDFIPAGSFKTARTEEEALHEFFKEHRVFVRGRATEWFEPEIKADALHYFKESRIASWPIPHPRSLTSSKTSTSPQTHSSTSIYQKGMNP